MKENGRESIKKKCFDFQGNKIQAVVSDYDGTIAVSGMKEPSEELFFLLEKLLHQNIRFISASGRQYQNLRDRFALCGQDRLYMRKRQPDRIPEPDHI